MTRAEHLADAIEAIRSGRCPEGDALRLALEVLEDRVGVDTELARRAALRLWAELWASGGFDTKSAVDERVGARVNRAPATIRWWRHVGSSPLVLQQAD